MISFSGAFLLALLSFGSAHVSIIYLHSQEEGLLSTVTSLLKDSTTVAGVDKNEHSNKKQLSLDGDAVTGIEPASVVQDWSLVCKQLCGAELGGPLCTPHCTDAFKSPTLRRSKTLLILNQDAESICTDLCKLQLGGTSCRCTNTDSSRYHSMKQTDLAKLNAVCITFCQNSATTLNGCSLCAEQRDAPSPHNFVATTPNWNDLCAALCRTGDGGSLCNCDLSPFF